MLWLYNPIAHAIFYNVLALYLLTDGGNRVCRATLSRSGVKTDPHEREDDFRAGRIIGSFERLLIAIGLIAGSWEVLAGVVALKSVGRFKDLDEQISAEYFLVGSLFSLLWSVTVTGVWLAYDRNVGLNVSHQLEVTIVPNSEAPAKTDSNCPQKTR